MTAFLPSLACRKSGKIIKTKKFTQATFRMMCILKTVRVKDSNDGGFLYSKSSEWGKDYPDANGHHQSPIDFISNDATYDESLLESPLNVTYCTSRETDVLNDGQAVIVYPKNKGAETSLRFDLTQRSVISGGPFSSDHNYELAEIRFHWGSCNGRGSEHRVNGKAFPMEIQLIHWNSSLYQSLEEAVGKPHGLAAICVFVQVGKENPVIRTLFFDALCDVTYKGRQRTITVPFNPVGLLPELRDYWTYDGSLTAPPCNENTQWIMFRYPLMVSQNQVEEFRRLYNYSKGDQPPKGSDGRLVDNFRPVQPINNRVVRASFN